MDERQSRGLTPKWRKMVAIVHLVTSVSWLAMMLCVLAFGLRALTTGDAETLRAAYRMLPFLGDFLIVPLGVLSLGSGLVLALGTPWGLFRFHWVTVKFWVTLAALTASVLALRPKLHQAADVAASHPAGPISAMHLGFQRYNLVIIPCVALGVYLTNVVLSMVKPWGRRRPLLPNRSSA